MVGKTVDKTSEVFPIPCFWGRGQSRCEGSNLKVAG